MAVLSPPIRWLFIIKECCYWSVGHCDYANMSIQSLTMTVKVVTLGQFHYMTELSGKNIGNISILIECVLKM